MIAKVIGSGFGSGLLPIFQRTIASLLVCGIWLLIYKSYSFEASRNFAAAFAAVFIVIGIPSVAYCEKVWGYLSDTIVIDDMIGMAIALLGVVNDASCMLWIVLSFVSYRALGELKWFGIGRLEKESNPLYLIADDILAGIYTLLIMFSLQYYLNVY